MLQNGPSLRYERMVGMALLGFMLLVAWRFYLERMTTADSAFFTWMLIDTHLPYAALGRVGSWLPQMPSLFFIRMHASLEVVLRSYSVSLVLVHVGVFAMIAFKYRDHRATLALLISLVAGTQQMFYFAISELYQGMSILLLVWVLAGRSWEAPDRRSRIRWGMAAALLNIWCSFYHQLLVLPLLFILVHEMIGSRRWHHRHFRLLAWVLVGTFVLRIVLMSGSAYEQSRIPTVADIVRFAPHLRHLGSTEHLLQVRWVFKALLLLVCATSIALVFLRKWLVLLWTALFSVGFLVLILITDRDGGSPLIYENYYPVFALVWGVVFAECWPLLLGTSLMRLRWPTLLSVLGLGCVQLFRGHYPFSDKIAYLERITAEFSKQGQQKVLIHPASYPWQYAYDEWPLAFESALVSGIKGSEEAVTLFIDRKELRLDTVQERPNVFFGPTWSPLWFTSDHLNADYFRFEPQGYVSANTVMPDSLLPTFLGSNIVLLPQVGVLHMRAQRYTQAMVRIINRSASTLNSIAPDGTPLRIYYSLFDEQGQLYADHPCHTELEVDVPAGSSRAIGVHIERPVKSGRYRVDVELITDAGGPMGSSTSFWIEARRFR